MASQDPVGRYNELLASSKFLFVVYFRGHWCPFCMGYLKTLQSLSTSISAAGGQPLVITAESAPNLATTRTTSGYNGEAIVDPENILVEYFKERGLLDVAISEKKGYEHGMAQPAILVIKSDGTVLEKWAIVPSKMNLGGAKDRPELGQVWDNVQALLEGKQKVHRAYKLISAWNVIKGVIFG
ncbi:hypothetical protein N431DRAFT_441934 [Stipitochalara longipes BDJ]|nr:hypothetical protein N431DRAFT_441934 [Stipitochalara longipes BDJ]